MIRTLYYHFRTVMAAGCILAGMLLSTSVSAEMYAVANMPTPVFNVPDFARLFGGTDGAALVTDECRQMRQLEFVALPGTAFRVEDEFQTGKADVIRVSTSDYPYASPTGYYIDRRFVTFSETKPPERIRRLPSREVVLDRLLKAQGSIYVWGGNVRSGIPQMRDFYPPAGSALLSPATATRWELRGVDCSGLLYEATEGFTPRNTSSLIHFGKPVPIEGLTNDQIAARVKPLDLIVWKGHVMIILDGGRVIESYLDCGNEGGVVVRPLEKALAQIRKKRAPLDRWRDEEESVKKSFVIRRWYE